MLLSIFGKRAKLTALNEAPDSCRAVIGIRENFRAAVPELPSDAEVVVAVQKDLEEVVVLIANEVKTDAEVVAVVPKDSRRRSYSSSTRSRLATRWSWTRNQTTYWQKIKFVNLRNP